MDYLQLARDIMSGYSDRNGMYARMDALYFQQGQFDEDEDEGAEVQRVTMPYATNVVDLVQDLAAVRKVMVQVPASSESKKAKQEADLLEKWFTALMQQNEKRQRVNFRKDGAWYAAQRGCIVGRVLYLEKEKFPVVMQLRDPAQVYFRWDIGPIAAVECYRRPSWQVQRLYPGVLDPDAGSEVEWVEYWDDKVVAYFCDGKAVPVGGMEVRPHFYGRLPYAIEKARGTPLATERFRPMLVGVEKVLQNLDVLGSIIATAGMASVASAWAVYSRRYGPDSQQRELDLTANAVNYFDPSAGEDVKPLQRASLPADFFQLFSTFLQAFQQGTIPLALFGESNVNMAGYAINLLTQQGQRSLGPIWSAIEKMHEDLIEISAAVLHEVVAVTTPGPLSIFINQEREGGEKGKLYRRELKIDPKDLEDDFSVVVSLESPIPADQAADLRQAMEAWKSGFLSKETALTKFKIVPDPTDEIDRTIIEQMYLAVAQQELKEVAIERGYLPEENAPEEKALSAEGGQGEMRPQVGPEPGGPGAFPQQGAMQQMAPMTPAALPEMKEMAGQPPTMLPGMAG